MSEREIKIATKAIRLARLAIENYIEWTEAGEGGPLEQTAHSEIIRFKAEIGVLIALLDEALARTEEPSCDQP